MSILHFPPYLVNFWSFLEKKFKIKTKRGTARTEQRLRGSLPCSEDGQLVNWKTLHSPAP